VVLAVVVLVETSTLEVTEQTVAQILAAVVVVRMARQAVVAAQEL
jgi:hypothetical protein